MYHSQIAFSQLIEFLLRHMFRKRVNRYQSNCCVKIIETINYDLACTG